MGGAGARAKATRRKRNGKVGRARGRVPHPRERVHVCRCRWNVSLLRDEKLAGGTAGAHALTPERPQMCACGHTNTHHKGEEEGEVQTLECTRMASPVDVIHVRHPPLADRFRLFLSASDSSRHTGLTARGEGERRSGTPHVHTHRQTHIHTHTHNDREK